jgi:multiple sugar transport system substrate-binding protein
VSNLHLSRRPALLAAVAAAGLALSACASGSSTTSTSSAPAATSASSSVDSTAPVTITWWTGQSAEAETILEGLAKDFMAIHKNVTIKVAPGAATTDELKQKIAAGFVADNYPDLSYAFGSWATELGMSGKTLDLAAAVADPAVKWEEIPEAARKTASRRSSTIWVSSTTRRSSTPQAWRTRRTTGRGTTSARPPRS